MNIILAMVNEVFYQFDVVDGKGLNRGMWKIKIWGAYGHKGVGAYTYDCQMKGSSEDSLDFYQKPSHPHPYPLRNPHIDIS